MSKNMSKQNLRELPSVDEVLRSDNLQKCVALYSKNLVTEIVRDILKKMRSEIIENHIIDISVENIGLLVKNYFKNMLKPSLKKIVNASGVVLHTNLGRAILCDEAS